MTAMRVACVILLRASEEKCFSVETLDARLEALFWDAAHAAPARVGHGEARLFLLQDGRWTDRQVLPPGFAAQMGRPQNTGGPPVGLPCGLFWWAVSGPLHIASGYAGQAMRLMRGRNFQAAQKRMALNGK